MKSNKRYLFTGYLPGVVAPGIDISSCCTSWLTFLVADRTCRLRVWVFKEVHLSCTSFLELTLEIIYGLNINIFLWQTIPSIDDRLRKKSENVYHNDCASSPFSKCVLWLRCLQPSWKMTKEWMTICSSFLNNSTKSALVTYRQTKIEITWNNIDSAFTISATALVDIYRNTSVCLLSY